jgi:uncharacterized membrane protein
MSNQAEKSSIFHITMFSFSGSKTAGEVFKRLKSSNEYEGYNLIAQAVVERDLDGQIHVHEPGAGGIGTTVGVIAGGVLGVLFSPLAVLVLATTGGAVGGITGHFAGRLIPKEDLEQLAASLPVNSSAFVALVEDTEAERVLDSMKGYNANVVTVTIGDELSGVIDQYISGEINLPPSELAQSAATSTPAQSADTPPTQGAVATPTSQAPAEEKKS